MREELQLNTVTPTASKNLLFNADGISIVNLTPYPVLVRRGAPDIPTLVNYDHMIPAGGATVLSVTGVNFGFRLLIPAQLPDNVNELKAQITLFDCEELTPTFGTQYFNIRARYDFSLTASQSEVAIIETFNARFINLSISHNGVVSGLLPLVGTLNIEQSYDGLTWLAYDIRNVWSAATSVRPPTLIIPSPAPYLRVTFTTNADLTGTCTGSIYYVLLDQSIAVPDDNYSFIVYSDSDAGNGAWVAAQTKTLIDKDMQGCIKSLNAYIINSPTVPAEDFLFTVEITIDLTNVHRFYFGHMGGLGGASQLANRRPLPAPQTIAIQTPITLVTGMAFLYDQPIDLYFQRHIKITVQCLTLSSVVTGKFMANCEATA